MTDIHLETYEVAKIRSALHWLIGYSEGSGIVSGVKMRIDEILKVMEEAGKRGPYCGCHESESRTETK